jgi:hypothetical protein
MDGELVLYEFTRSKVERGDFSEFLNGFSLDSLPPGRRLRQMMNSFVFCIGGYDSDPREVYSIPDVRAFYRKFHSAWPYWLYFCSLDDSDALRNMIFCRMDSFISLHVDGKDQVKLEYEGDELLALIRADFPAMIEICKRGDMFDDLIETRKRAVLDYFKLPSDSRH